MTFLDGSQDCVPGSPTRRQILETFWGIADLQGQDSPSAPYFKYYVEELRHALHDQGRHVSVQTHQDILHIVTYLRQDHSRDNIFAILRYGQGPGKAWTEDQIEGSIDLAARLLTMVDIGQLRFGFSGRKALEWSNGGLLDLLASHFQVPHVLSHDGTKLEKRFNARALSKIAGVKIIWTNNLADHLRLIDDDKKVAVFHFASFLEYNRSNNAVLPSGLAEETLKTLAMLFPYTDAATKKWLARRVAIAEVDPQIVQSIREFGRLKPDDRKIERFEFWHDRIVLLKEVYDDARPRMLSQLWYDRRNGLQWYTFWIAIVLFVLTVVFGLIQSIEGGMQAYVSYKQWKASPS